MPQIKIKHCCIADVLPDDNPVKQGNGQVNDKVVVLRFNEEDFFEMLDSVNPKNIVKYLFMRGHLAGMPNEKK